jgi:hypothetical protein
LFCLLIGGGCSRGPDQVAAVDPGHVTRDAEIFRILREHGADLSKPRHALFFAVFDMEQAATEAERAAANLSLAKEQDFRTSFFKNSAGTITLRMEAEMIINEERLAGLRQELTSFASRHGGEYDGWEAAATP